MSSGSTTGFAAALLGVGLAEIGDKTQLAVLLLAAHGRPLRVIAGAGAAFALLAGAAVVLGAAGGRWLDGAWVHGIAALLFAVIGLSLLFGSVRGEQNRESAAPRGAGFLEAFGVVAAAEMGDKTQIATAALAGTHAPLAVWAGATLALTALAFLATLVGRGAIGRLRPERVRRVAGVLFLAFAGLEIGRSFS